MQKTRSFRFPPYAEQQRIVARVDELMDLCDQLERLEAEKRAARAEAWRVSLARLLDAPDAAAVSARWSSLSAQWSQLLDAPESVAPLRQTILGLAVRGQLVPQDAFDEPASHLLKQIAAEKARKVKAGELRQSAPLAPISDDEMPFELPESWAWVRLGELVTMMDAGWSPACENGPTEENDEWGVLKTTSVQQMQFWEHEHKRLPQSLKPRPENEVRAGDLLITRAGPKNRVGISCLVKATRSKLMISDKLIRFHLWDNYLHPDYVILCLNAGVSAEFIERQKSGMAASQVNISQPKLKLTPLGLPPLAEQQRIVARVDELMALCDQLEAGLVAAQSASEALGVASVRRLSNG